jgi:hypothetical protein
MNTKPLEINNYKINKILFMIYKNISDDETTFYKNPVHIPGSITWEIGSYPRLD